MSVWLFIGGLAAIGWADGWSGFQNGGHVVLDGAPGLPLHWSPENGIAWHARLAGYGQSSPVVHDRTIYVTSTSGPNKEQLHVQAFDLETGAPRWRFDAANSSPEENTNYVSRAAPSPVCDADGVVALFEGGNVFALDRDGALRWQRDLVGEYGPIPARHGLGSSVEQDHDKVFVWIERQEDPYLVALNKSTGHVIWKAKGLGATTWSSPRLISVDGQPQLVLSAIGRVVGLDPSNGDPLWNLEGLVGNSTPTPVPLGDGRILLGATAGREDGGGAATAKSNGLVQISRRPDGRFDARFLWQADRATCSFGSPVADGEHAYFVNSSGVVYCLDLATGEERYAQRTASSVWATPIAAENRIYLFGKDGTTTVIAAGPEFQELAKNSLWSGDGTVNDADSSPSARPTPGVLYAAAAADGGFILRSGEWLFRITSSTPE